ncbi:hypothetical protein H0H92_002282 [Tricholoma furcatifolium]|nr:hypothetical protein H0H92_002282 [Tricholoma furcatifolium]
MARAASKAGARSRAAIDSDSEDSDTNQPPKKQSKRASKATQKIVEIDKENLEKAHSKILQLKKQVQKLKSKKTAEDDDDVDEATEGPESEDEDEIGFSSSIRPLQPIEEQEKTTPLQVRRINLTELNQSTARRRSSQPTRSNRQNSQDSSDEDDHNQKIAKDFNERVQTAATAAATNNDDTDSTDDKTKAGLLTPRLIPDVKETAPPAITDYASPIVRRLLLAAVRKYQGCIIGRNAFPSLAVQVSWATTVWQEAQDERNEKIGDSDGPQYELTDRMLRLIKRRGSRIQGDMLGVVRNEVQMFFGFRRDRASYIKKNADTATALNKNKSFHYRKQASQEGFYENAIILSVLTVTAFKDSGAPGVIFEDIFNPISLHTLALVLTLVDFCISEWLTGKFDQGVFRERLVKNQYEVFLADLTEWHHMNPEVTTNRRAKLYRRALKASGVEALKGPTPTLVGENRERARKELEGHTGETDSELDDKLDVSDEDEADGEEI